MRTVIYAILSITAMAIISFASVHIVYRTFGVLPAILTSMVMLAFTFAIFSPLEEPPQ
jgi:hypothetical protein